MSIAENNGPGGAPRQTARLGWALNQKLIGELRDGCGH